MDLTDIELRVLGCLIEKEMTTPDYYPMTLNSLGAACNQKSNRTPVVELTETEVIDALDGLRERGLARTVHGKGDRALKYKHVAPEILEVTVPQVALLAVLMLRGAQTLGELRSRTSRYVEFADLDEVATELAALAAAEVPRVERLERRPGEKEARYRHRLGGVVADLRREEVLPDVEDLHRIGELEAELDELRRRVARMESELGLDSAAPDVG